MDPAYGTVPSTFRKAPQAPRKRPTALEVAIAGNYVKDPKTAPQMLSWARRVLAEAK